MDTFIYWILIFIPAAAFPLIAIAYERLLNHKFVVIESILNTPLTLQKYTQSRAEKTGQVFKETNRAEIIKNLFLSFFHWKAYLIPLLFNITITILVTVLLQIKLGIYVAVPQSFAQILKGIPVQVIFAVFGAYLWGIYDMLGRYRTVDMTSESLYFIWLRMLIAGFLGYLISPGFNESLGALVAFAIGAFPIKTLRNFVMSKAKSQLKFDQSTEQAEESQLHKIQGMSKGMINRLSEEGFESVEHLAFADPLILLIRTNIEWKVILDIIDQSLLYVYLGEKAIALRAIGIRGAIEMAELLLDIEDEDSKLAFDNKVEIIADKTGETKIGITNLIQTIYEDSNVQFIWGLWGAILDFKPVDEEDEEDEEG